MIRFLSIALFIFVSASLYGRDFPYGKVSLEDLLLRRYAPDTSAGAVVLKEFGEAFINGDNYRLVYRYHVRIKILTKAGLDESDIEIPLESDGTSQRVEQLLEIKASTFNLVDGRVAEEAVDSKNIFTEERNKYINVRKFAFPNVHVGSVIELQYTLESPFIYNFRPWYFQSSIPKVESVYWARIPAVYRYNITLRGFLNLTSNESTIEKNCLGSSTSPMSGEFSADCSLMKLGMNDIPAFVEEDYMTARKNFISSVQFELSEVRYPNGRIDKVTKEWKDAEQELRIENRFGVQLRRGKDIGEEVRKIIEGEKDDLEKAKKVYVFIRDWYVWNDTYGKYSEHGIRKAFDDRKGNVGDINLSLVAALRFAGLETEPVILSTRANGTVVELHPVLSEFNYVIARVTIGDKAYLLDATEKYYPFGLLPERCLNGKGRVMGDHKSYWIDLKPSDVGKTVSVLSFVLDSTGLMSGTLETTFMGYDAVREREEILSFSSQEEYIQELKGSLSGLDIAACELKNIEDVERPVVRKLQIGFRAFDPEDANFLFNPFLMDRWTENPFKSNERLYPVDFGVPMERLTVFTLEYPSGYELVSMPERVGLALPNTGGRFLFEVKDLGSKLTLNHSLSIRKTEFTSTEYHYLKELFNRILQVQNGELIFRKKA